MITQIFFNFTNLFLNRLNISFLYKKYENLYNLYYVLFVALAIWKKLFHSYRESRYPPILTHELRFELQADNRKLRCQL